MINRNVRLVVANYLRSCVSGTRINATVLARQLSDRDRVFLAGTVSGILQGRNDLRCDSVNEFLVV
jgi:hypothetical protein